MNRITTVLNNRFVHIQIIALIYNLAANMIHPITPTLITELGLPDYMFGLLFASMSLGSFLFSPFWGRFADKYGRSPVMFITFLGYAFAQLGFGYSTDPVVMTVFRFIGGSFTGGTTVAMMAVVVDISDIKQRASKLSYFAANASVSGSIGYFLGGMLGVAVPLKIVFWAHSALLITGGILSCIIVRDTDKRFKSEEPSESKIKHSTLGNARDMLPVSAMMFLVCVALANLSTAGYDNSFNYFIKSELNFPSSANGIIKAVVGIMGLIANMVVNPWIVRNFDSRRALVIILMCCSVTLLMVTFMASVIEFIAVNLVFYLFNSMYMPLQQSLIAQDRRSDCGLMSGLFYSSRSFGMIIGALSAGFLYSVNPRLPFYVQMVMFAMAAFVAHLSLRILQKECRK